MNHSANENRPLLGGRRSIRANTNNTANSSHADTVWQLVAALLLCLGIAPIAAFILVVRHAA